MSSFQDRAAAIREAAAGGPLFPTAVHAPVNVERDRDAILGGERRLEREEIDGLDTTIARLAIARKYSAYAAAVVRRTGGDVDELKSLTDRNNMAPLAWSGGHCSRLD